MIKIIGAGTGKIYAQGEEADCFRHLYEQFPSNEEVENHNKFGRPKKNKKVIYPEELLIIRT